MTDYRWNQLDIARGYDAAAGVVHPYYHVVQDVILEHLSPALGGYFASFCKHHQSVARVFPAATISPAAEHPINRGRKEFTLHDEPYINNCFGKDGNRPASNVTSLATSLLPAEAPKRETVAWCVERPNGGRGFGIVMPHFYRNWTHEDLRRFILNGIVWTAKLEVPADGVKTAPPDLAAFKPESLMPQPWPKKPQPAAATAEIPRAELLDPPAISRRMQGQRAGRDAAARDRARHPRQRRREDHRIRTAGLLREASATAPHRTVAGENPQIGKQAMNPMLTRIIVTVLPLVAFGAHVAGGDAAEPTIAGHAVKLDSQGKIIPWYSPAEKAYSEFLHRRWNFIKSKVPPSPGPPPRSDYPQYYFYDGYVTKEAKITPDNWMNDVGEKIPNWFESARLYYAFSGDAEVMALVRKLIDYTLQHGTSPADFAWPHFPYTTTKHGDLDFKGFTPTFALHETHVDHAGDIGLTYYRLYQFTGDEKYRTAAIRVADVLAANARTGTTTHSVWPYRVRMDSGEITAQYGANWIGCYALLDELVRAGLGNTEAYTAARAKARDFILQHPMQTGYWTDGHSDNPVNSHTYRSNLSKSNALLYIFDHPDFDPDWRTNVPKYIRWTENYFVHRTSGGEPATAFGANVVGEQDGFNFKMDYQTARYAAECARWYRVSGDESYREKAYRCLNWVTYCSDADGRATESPYSLNIASWWSDCYGECPRMFYQAFAAMPEWAPPREDHILYSYGILADISYRARELRYTARDAQGTEYLRLSYLPSTVTLNGKPVDRQTDSSAAGWSSRELGGGDHAVTIRRTGCGQVRVASDERAVLLPSRLRQ